MESFIFSSDHGFA